MRKHTIAFVAVREFSRGLIGQNFAAARLRLAGLLIWSDLVSQAVRFASCGWPPRFALNRWDGDCGAGWRSAHATRHGGLRVPKPLRDIFSKMMKWGMHAEKAAAASRLPAGAPGRFGLLYRRRQRFAASLGARYRLGSRWPCKVITHRRPARFAPCWPLSGGRIAKG